VYAAKKTVPVGMNIAEDDALADVVKTGKFVAQFEVHCCPFCQSLNFDEIPTIEKQVEAVYVHDLTATGPQTDLDGLLAQGYVIVGRYAKQYILEKAKSEEKGEGK
jgi:hypothetical protein